MLRNIIGPIFDSRRWSIFSFCVPFLKDLILPAERKTFSKIKKENLDQFLTKKRHRLDQFLTLSLSIYKKNIYIHAVELNTGPRFALSSVKNWSKFLVFDVFLFLKISFSLQKEEDVWKNKNEKKKKNTQWPNSCVKNWSNYVAQHAWTNFKHNLGPVFNNNFCFFVKLFCFGGGLKPSTFIVFSATNGNFKRMQKTKKTLLVSRPVLTALVKCPFFFCIFHFVFFATSKFLRGVFFIGSQEIKKQNNKNKQ